MPPNPDPCIDGVCGAGGGGLGLLGLIVIGLVVTVVVVLIRKTNASSVEGRAENALIGAIIVGGFIVAGQILRVMQ